MNPLIKLMEGKKWQDGNITSPIDAKSTVTKRLELRKNRKTDIQFDRSLKVENR